MMGNVSGVSQFLETVTLPSAQAGVEGAPTQDFAAVMQQTSNESGTPLPLSTSDAFGRQAEENNAAAAGPSSQTASPLAQSKLPTITIASDKDSLLRFTQSKPAQGQLQSNTGPAAMLDAGATTSSGKTTTASLPTAPNNAVVGKSTATVKGVPAASAKASPAALSDDPSAIAAEDAVATGKVSPTPALNLRASSLDASQTMIQATDESEVTADAEAIAGDAAAALKAQAITPPPAQGTGLQPKVVKDALAVGAKQAVKPADTKIASKLTAIVPQGTTDVPQSAVLPFSTINTAAPVALAMPIGAASAGSFETSGLENTSVSAHATRTVASAAMPLFGDSPVKTGAVDASTSTPQASTATPTTFGAQSQATHATGIPTLSAPDAVVTTTSLAGFSGLTTQFTQATQGSVSTTAGASAEQTSVTFNAGAIPTGPAATAPKSGLQQSGRAGHTSTKPIAETTSGPASASAAVQGVQAGAITPIQSAKSATESTVQASRLPNDPAGAAVSDTKAALKQANPGPVAGAAQHGGAETRQALANTLSTATPIAAKDSTEAVTAPVLAPIVVVPAASIGAMSMTAAVSVPASLPHAAAGSGTNASSSVSGGIVSASQGTTALSSTGSLPHTTLTATPNSLEVGVSSGTHGWLKIRAELNAAGEVDASLTGANSAAASKLRGDLPALSSFLQSEKVQMGALDVRSALHSATTAFESSSTFSQGGSGQSGAGGANGAAVSADAGAAGNRAQQQAQQSTDSAPGPGGSKESDAIVLGRVTDAVAYGNQTELGGSDGSSSVGYGAGGGWLNVRV